VHRGFAVEITRTFEAGSREAWRRWLAEHHDTETEIWLLYHRGRDARPGELTYLDAVEEALCFGWVDGIAKRHGEFSAQRFTPRRPRSHWTELNKERARRLIEEGRMTEAGRRILPDLDPTTFAIPAEIEAALRADPMVWANFQSFPPLYQRVRVGYVGEMLGRNKAEYDKRLGNLIERTRRNQMFGNWDDRTMPVTIARVVPRRG